MDVDFNNGNNVMSRKETYNDEISMEVTYKALVDAIIPRTPKLAKIYGEIQYFGALDQDTAGYLIMTLNYYFIPLAAPIAQLINEAAAQYIVINVNSKELISYTDDVLFSLLSPDDRLYVLDFIEQLKETEEYVISITSSLNRFTVFGYYSEWFGYGTTKFESPNDRILEFYPLSWDQVGYPGPSLGYPSLRVFNYLPTLEYEL